MERSPEILDLYLRMTRGDLRDVPSEQLVSTSPAVSVLGTDPTEWVTDRASIIQAFEAQQAASGAGVQTLPSNTQAWSDGDLGWVVDQPRVRTSAGAEVQLRVTSIVHREEGTWKLVHQHVSIGVPNDQVEAFRGM